MRFLGAAALVAGMTVLLTGCGSQAVQPTSTPSVTVAPTSAPEPTASAASPSATPEPAPSGSPTVSPTGTPTAKATAKAGTAPADQCPDADLGVSVAPAQGGGGAGSADYEVLFVNTGGETCALRGTPGVSVTGPGNEQLGAAADRVQTGARTVVLRSGDTVRASLRIVNIGTDGGPLEGCTVRKGVGYRVFPPHSTKPFPVEDPTAVACAPGPSFMTVGPVVR